MEQNNWEVKIQGKDAYITNFEAYKEYLINFNKPKFAEQNKWEEEFDKWAEETTATFGSDGEDDYSISFKSLDFYDELKDKIKSLLSSHNQKLLEQIEGMTSEFFSHVHSVEWNEGYESALDDIKDLLTKEK